MVAQSDLRRVERLARKVAESRDELRDAMVAAHDSGESYRDIARAAGISHQRVAQIITDARRQ